MKKFKVAVTGNIGSGKSSFCKFLEEMNYVIIKADEIAKELMISDSKIKSKIIKHFGNSAYTKLGLNKLYLAEKIFSDPSNVEKINSIVHSAVIKKVKLMMNEQLKSSDIVFHEAALVYEAGFEDIFDIVVLITADQKIRMERKKLSEKLTEADFLKREANQIAQEEKVRQADFVFTNNGAIHELKTKADFLIRIIQGMK